MQCSIKLLISSCALARHSAIENNLHSLILESSFSFIWNRLNNLTFTVEGNTKNNRTKDTVGTWEWLRLTQKDSSKFLILSVYLYAWRGERVFYIPWNSLRSFGRQPGTEGTVQSQYVRKENVNTFYSSKFNSILLYSLHFLFPPLHAVLSACSSVTVYNRPDVKMVLQSLFNSFSCKEIPPVPPPLHIPPPPRCLLIL